MRTPGHPVKGGGSVLDTGGWWLGDAGYERTGFD